jgi:hypothetical protein
MHFQVTVSKILVSYPDGFALMADLKRNMAILATSGRDWAERTKRLASRVPDLDIFSQKVIARTVGRITDKGRGVLGFMEARPAADRPSEDIAVDRHLPPAALQLPLQRGRRRRERRRPLGMDHGRTPLSEAGWDTKKCLS